MEVKHVYQFNFSQTIAFLRPRYAFSPYKYQNLKWLKFQTMQSTKIKKVKFSNIKALS